MPDARAVTTSSIAGAGNAALCAAPRGAGARRTRCSCWSARREHLRGGNTYFTGGGFRFPYGGIDDIRALIPDLSDAEMARHRRRRISRGVDARRHDARVGGARRRCARSTSSCGARSRRCCWMRDAGVRWVLQYGRQAFESGGVRRFWGGLITEAVGGGKGLSDTLFEIALKAGVEIRYETQATALVRDASGRVCGVVGAVAGRAAPDRRRAPSCWRAAASRRTRRCGRATLGRAGSWRRCAARASTRATASAWRSTSARCRTGTGAAATPSPGT